MKNNDLGEGMGDELGLTFQESYTIKSNVVSYLKMESTYIVNV